MFRYFTLTILAVIFSITATYSQDTASVYFKVGSHKLSDWSQKVLQKTFADLDYTDLEHIAFIGYSDSTGKIDSNQKLSERRAKAVLKFSERFMESKIPTDIQSKGEIPRIVDSLSRRVDVVFHYRSSDDWDQNQNKDTLVIVPKDPRCFFIDEHIEAFGHVTVRTHKKKQVVYLELLNEKEFSQRKYYYVKNPSKSTAVAQRVNFKLETTGMLWWREKRLTATIPLDSYKQYGLFYLEEPPCNGCKEQLFKKDTVVFTKTAILNDYFIMSVTQFKSKFFRPNVVKVRAPKEYILEGTSYYAVKDYGYEIKNEQLEWKEKRGKKKEDYLFSEIHMKGVRMASIARPQRMSYCPDKNTWPDRTGGGYYSWGCGNYGGRLSFPGSMTFLAGIHAFYHNDTVTAFVSVGLGYELGRNELALNIGLNHHPGLYYSAHYHVNFLDFTTMTNRMLDPWQKLNNSQFTTRIKGYVGPEFRSSYNQKYRSFSELNLHLGFSVAWQNGLNYYVQGGIARDLSGRINNGFYPYIQAGLRFMIKL
ncbi:OmpA family protein [Fluviicola sp.]|uniref:OmpA family protein n=1 Tax=Fluviicola sp. TaxID=1917219 RepID=UPI0031DB9F93